MFAPKPNQPADKPQGFKSAQLAKKGKYPCHYECTRIFRNKAEAIRHAADGSCPMKVEAFEELRLMAVRKGFTEDSPAGKNNKLGEAAAAARKKDDHIRLVNYLNNLPDIDRMDLHLAGGRINDSINKK